MPPSLAILDILLIFIFIILIITNIVKAPKITELNQELLDSFPFMIIITDKDFNVIKYNNSVENIEKFVPIDYDAHNSICYVSINKDYDPIRCYTFISDDKIYFVSRENKKTDIASILTLMSITDNPEDYFNKEIKIKTILEYTGKLLNCEWVTYYDRKCDTLIRKEVWQKEEHIQALHIEGDIIYLLDFDYTKPYFFITLDDIPDIRRKLWEQLNIQSKLIVPIVYDSELEKQITFTYTNNPTPNVTIINLVVGILNFIIKLKIKFEKEREKQKHLENIKNAILQYVTNENIRHEKNKEKMDKALQDTDRVIASLKRNVND